MSVSAKQVMDLRAATGMPMMKCKKALEAESGDFEKAIERLRKEGLKAAEGRAHRATAEGVVRALISENGERGSMIAVACESDPVSKTEQFTEFVDRLVAQVDEKAPADVEALLAQPWIDNADETVSDVLRGLIARIGENMRVLQVARLEVKGPGRVGVYVHHDRKSGAMVALGVEESAADPADFAKELSMHIVSEKATALSRDEIPGEVQNKELEIYRAQVENDPKMAKKPEQVIEKIVEGKLQAFFRQSVLTEQPWFKEQARSVADLLKEHHVTLQAFNRLAVGS